MQQKVNVNAKFLDFQIKLDLVFECFVFPKIKLVGHWHASFEKIEITIVVITCMTHFNDPLCDNIIGNKCLTLSTVTQTI